MNRSFRHLILFSYGVAAAVLAIDALLVASSLRTIALGEVQVDQTRSVLFGLERVVSLVKDAENGQRGYLLTGRASYLTPYLEAQSAIAPALQGLRSSAKEDGLEGRIDDLAGFVRAKMDELDETIQLRRRGAADEALRVVLSDRGQDVMDRIREGSAAVRAEEDHLLEARQAASRSAVRRTIASFGLSTALSLMLLVVSAYFQRREVRERGRAKAAIRAGEAWLSTVLTSIGDAVIATDGEGRVRFLNPVAQRLTGWSRSEATGRPILEVFPIINERTRQTVEDPVARVIREGKIVGLGNATLLIRRDGIETPIDDSAAPIEDDRGAIAGVVLVFRDISDRKSREALDEERRRLAEFGRDVGLALAESPDLATMARRCAEETVRHLDAAFSRIWTVDEPGQVLELIASAGMYTHLDGPHARVPVGMYKIGKIAEEQAPHVTNSVIGDSLVPAQEWAAREGMVAFAGYPLVVEGRLVGVWAMFARRTLSEETIRAMESVARGVAVGIERAQAEGRLRREREWLQVTLSSIGDAVIATDGEGRVRFLNPVAEGLTGWSAAQAAGMPIERIFVIVDELTRQPAESPVDRVIREGVVVGLANHTIIIARDGTETPIEESAAPIQGPDGHVVGVVMVFQDATERRRNDAALRLGEERYRALVEAFSQIVWRTDPDGLIVDDSPSWREFTGQTFEQWSGVGWLDALHPDDRGPAAEAWNHAVASRGLYQVDYRLRRADGAYRWMVARGVPIVQSDGQIREWIGTNTDVTELKRSQEELRSATEEAEQANRAKTQFLAVLSHELRTPLNPILLAVSSMLERATSADDVRSNLVMIRQNVQLQSRLIDDLLDVMRIVRGKMPLHWEVVDAHLLIGHSVGICRSEVFGKGLKLDLSLDAASHHINADPVRLQQVFWNLIKNAVKFTPSGGSITIRTGNEPDDSPEGKLVVEIVDTGIGVEPEFLGRIFDPFQQGETSITRRFGGLGLGLAISKGIVEGHGGLLEVRSPGKDRGTTFRLELKALPVPKLEAAGRPSDPSLAPEPDSVPSLNILLVEDEQATRRLMARLLRGLGHEVTAAGTITEALERERSGEFGLIVSDIGLPDGSGLELMRQVVARRGPVPAIALTGYGMEEDIRRSREAGFTAHMTKPIDFTKLEAMIRQVAS